MKFEKFLINYHYEHMDEGYSSKELHLASSSWIASRQAERENIMAILEIVKAENDNCVCYGDTVIKEIVDRLKGRA